MEKLIYVNFTYVNRVRMSCIITSLYTTNFIYYIILSFGKLFYFLFLSKFDIIFAYSFFV